MKKIWESKWSAALAALLCLSLAGISRDAAASPGASRLTVMQSNTDRYRRGELVAGNKIRLADGEAIVVVDQDATTTTLKGPCVGVAECASVPNRFLNTLLALFIEGDRGTAVPGGGRGPGAVDHPVILVGRSDILCLQDGWVPEVRRSSRSEAADYSLEMIHPEPHSAEVSFSAGAIAVPWPLGSVPLANGGVYVLRSKVQPSDPGYVVIHFVAPMDSFVQETVWMQERGCVRQALERAQALSPAKEP